MPSSSPAGPSVGTEPEPNSPALSPGRPFRGMAPGSRKSRGGFWIARRNPPQSALIVESDVVLDSGLRRTLHHRCVGCDNQPPRAVRTSPSGRSDARAMQAVAAVSASCANTCAQRAQRARANGARDSRPKGRDRAAGSTG